MSMQFLNLAPALFCLSLFFTGCGHHDQSQVMSADAKLRDALTGTWTKDDPSLGSVSLASNGTFIAQWNTSNSPMKVWAFEGTWAAKGGLCVSTTTKTRSWGTTNRVAEGRTDRYRIIRVDEEHLVWECDGQTISLIRKK